MIFKAIGKVFKGVGKVFKGIGKGIMKKFKSIGKFINKLGIFGQIGMALIMPGIANFALSSLSSLGTGFMSSLATTAAGEGFKAGLARVTHAVLKGAVKAGSTIAGKVKSIADTATGLIGDSIRTVGNSVGLPVDPVQVTDAAGNVVANPTPMQQATQTLKNAGNKVSTGFKEFTTGMKDVGRIAQDTVTGDYAPRYETFTEAGKPSLFSKTPTDPVLVTKEVGYDTAARQAYEQSPEFFATTEAGQAKISEFLKTPEGTEFLTGTPAGRRASAQSLLDRGGYMPENITADPSSIEAFNVPESYFPEGMPKAVSPDQTLGTRKTLRGSIGESMKLTSPTQIGQQAVSQYAMSQLSQAQQVYQKPADFAGAFDRTATAKIAMDTAATGRGVSLEAAGETFEKRFGQPIDSNLNAFTDRLASLNNEETFWPNYNYVREHFQNGSNSLGGVRV